MFSFRKIFLFQQLITHTQTAEISINSYSSILFFVFYLLEGCLKFKSHILEDVFLFHSPTLTGHWKEFLFVLLAVNFYSSFVQLLR